jgi:hypothetical protein
MNSSCHKGAKKMEQTILTAVSAVGFPIVVTFYLLTSFQKSMDKFTDKLGELIQELRRVEK